MIVRADLEKIARSRLRAASVLHRSRAYDEAFYLCGYAVEIALKARICRTLRWEGFPETGGEFQNFKSFQTHNFVALLALTGIEAHFKAKVVGDWSVVTDWNPELRYRPIGTKTTTESADMIAATRNVLKVLL